MDDNCTPIAATPTKNPDCSKMPLARPYGRSSAANANNGAKLHAKLLGVLTVPGDDAPN
jgi:hypothetical protein